MYDWNEIRKQIESYPIINAGWDSDKKHLLEIIDKIIEYKIDPPEGKKTELSHLREIVKYARIAIAEGNVSRLKELIDLAYTKTIKDIRIELRGDKRNKVFFNQIHKEGGDEFYVILTETQFKEIEYSFRSKYSFILNNVVTGKK